MQGTVLAMLPSFRSKVSSNFRKIPVVTFIIKVNGTGRKLVNGMTLDDSMGDAMRYLQKDVSILLKPERISITNFTEIKSLSARSSVRVTDKKSRHFDVERVKILKNKKSKIPGSTAVPYTATILTILVLAYK